MAGKKIDEGTRQKVKEAYASGLSMRKIAKECGIGSSSVDRIVKENGLQKGQEKGTKKKAKTHRQKRIEELEIRIEELERKILELKAKKRSSR